MDHNSIEFSSLAELKAMNIPPLQLRQLACDISEDPDIAYDSALFDRLRIILSHPCFWQPTSAQAQALETECLNFSADEVVLKSYVVRSINKRDVEQTRLLICTDRRLVRVKWDWNAGHAIHRESMPWEQCAAAVFGRYFQSSSKITAKMVHAARKDGPHDPTGRWGLRIFSNSYAEVLRARAGEHSVRDAQRVLVEANAMGAEDTVSAAAGAEAARVVLQAQGSHKGCEQYRTYEPVPNSADSDAEHLVHELAVAVRAALCRRTRRPAQAVYEGGIGRVAHVWGALANVVKPLTRDQLPEPAGASAARVRTPRPNLAPDACLGDLYAEQESDMRV